MKKIKSSDKRTCNQCHNQMHIADAEKHYFCARLECPNFALLQIPSEFLVYEKVKNL